MSTPRIVIATRTRDVELYAMASSFWPPHITRMAMAGHDHWHGALSYLQALERIDADFVVNCDEDCFVFDWSAVERLIADMERNDGFIAGMPDDRENCHHRDNSRHLFNPFFTITRPALVRSHLATVPWYDPNTVAQLRVPGAHMHEPFNSYFEALLWEQPGSLFLLTGKDHADGFSTVLHGIHQGTEGDAFALHSWYARNFRFSQRERILALYEEARKRAVSTGVHG